MITYASATGNRPYNEDRVLWHETPEGTLLGVFDGHNGDEVSALLASTFGNFWSAIDGERYSTAMYRVFEMAESLTHHYRQGSTASVVFIPKNATHAIVAVLGDSPVLIDQADHELFIGPDHNVRSNLEERIAAENRGGIYSGGYIWNSMGDLGAGLQMTRALGDSEMNRILNRVPELFTVPLGDWLLVGSDGLFDPKHTSHPERKIAERIRNGAAVKDLIDDALAVPTNDNATAVLWLR
jgi:serine/threonine protein phosphatase PrpC